MWHRNYCALFLLVLSGFACRDSNRTPKAMITVEVPLPYRCLNYADLVDLFPDELAADKILRPYLSPHYGWWQGDVLPLSVSDQVLVADSCAQINCLVCLFTNGVHSMVTVYFKSIFGWREQWQSELLLGEFNCRIKATDINQDGTPDIIASRRWGQGNGYESVEIYSFNGGVLKRMTPAPWHSLSILTGGVNFIGTDSGTIITVHTPSATGLVNTYFIGNGSDSIKLMSSRSRWDNLQK